MSRVINLSFKNATPSSGIIPIVTTSTPIPSPHTPTPSPPSKTKNKTSVSEIDYKSKKSPLAMGTSKVKLSP